MSRLYIHIGAHKTGTTSLQRRLELSSRALNAAGITYLRSNWYHFAQHRLAFAMKAMRDPARGDKPDLETEVDELNRAIAGAGTARMLISSEEFFSCDPAKVQEFRALLKIADVRILATVRRPDEMLLSMYNQKTKHPGNKFAQPLKAFVARPEQIDPDIEYHKNIGGWVSAFGRENLTLQVYENESSIAAMRRVLGLAEDALTEDVRINEAVTSPVVEVMRIAKNFGMDGDRQRELYDHATRLFAQSPRMFLGVEDRKSIVSHFEAQNDALFAQFGMINPYRIDGIAWEDDEKIRPNITLMDMMRLVNSLLETNPAKARN